MKWLLDPGGTRLKWARMPHSGPLEFGGAPWAEVRPTLEKISATNGTKPAEEQPCVYVLKRSVPPAADLHGFSHWLASLQKGAVQDFDPVKFAPFSVGYTEGTPGSDRIAAAAACHERDPGGSFVIVDAGTCITVDLLSPGLWRGGAILPGLNLQAQSMAKAGLPVLTQNEHGQWPHQKGHLGALGTSTQGALQAGIAWATLKSVAGVVASLIELDPCAQIILTGGDAAHFDGLNGWQTFADPNLVLSGAAALLTPS